jgi:hypothetical protein
MTRAGWMTLWTAKQSGLRTAPGPSTSWVPLTNRLTVHHLHSILDGQDTLAIA